MTYEFSLPIARQSKARMQKELELPQSFNIDPLRMLHLLKEKNRAQDFFRKINKDDDDGLTRDELSLLFKVIYLCRVHIQTLSMVTYLCRVHIQTVSMVTCLCRVHIQTLSMVTCLCRNHTQTLYMVTCLCRNHIQTLSMVTSYVVFTYKHYLW